MCRARPIVLLALLLAGCPSNPPGGQDAGPDGGIEPDGGSSGLIFEFVDDPALPVNEEDVTVTDMELSLKDVRAIGDSSPGTGPTYLDMHVLSWEGGADASRIVFAEAPTGIYSLFATQLVPTVLASHSYRIRGTVLLDGEVVEFEIRDEVPLDLDLELGTLELEPGEDVTVRVRCDLAEIALSLDWAAQPRDGDRIRIEDDSPLIDEIRAQVEDSFEIAEVIDD